MYEYRSAPGNKLYFTLAGIYFLLELSAIFGQWERWPFSGHALYAERLRPDQVKVFEFFLRSANESMSEKFFLINRQNCAYVEQRLAWRAASLKEKDPSAPITIDSHLLHFTTGPVLQRGQLEGADPCTLF